MPIGIRLYFECFSTNYYFSEQSKHRMVGVRLKNKLKAEVLAQLTGKYSRIHLSDCPVGIDYTFFSCHKYDVDNYSAMVKYIQDCLVFRGILQDDNPKIINEIRIRVRQISAPVNEGVYIRFYRNSEIEYPDVV